MAMNQLPRVKHPNLVLLGPPGAGKGTQAVRLAQDLGVPQLSTGDIFRNAIARDTPMGRAAKGYMDQGQLVPDPVVIGVVEEALGRPEVSAGFILDGFPRTVPQAEALERILAAQGQSLLRAILLVVPEAAVVERIAGRRTCGSCQATYHVIHAPPKKAGICDRCGGMLIQRSDEMPEAVAARLAVYHRQTEPLVSWYQQRDLLTRVDGMGPPEAVAARLRNAAAL